MWQTKETRKSFISGSNFWFIRDFKDSKVSKMFRKRRVWETYVFLSGLEVLPLVGWPSCPWHPETQHPVCHPTLANILKSLPSDFSAECKVHQTGRQCYTHYTPLCEDIWTVGVCLALLLQPIRGSTEFTQPALTQPPLIPSTITLLPYPIWS